MKEYESLYILKPDLAPEELEKEIQAVEAIISKEDGYVIEHTDWGKKRLAYVIAKQRYGHYMLFRFGAPPTVPEALTRHYRYNETILKGMVVDLDGKAGYGKEEREKAANIEEESGPQGESAVAEDTAGVAAAETKGTEEVEDVQPQ